ncbi:transglutaminase domain-containing protein [Dactylosporangium roseum]|uniref:Transglutaminase domain-containing protein n=1 Tax=Dactylosporangium roseum TaxID=47989 RepID=A0ABY5ZH91_9ACTN|nr:transglutaminase domain-containing protein [Dactylosporangium roseum]
MRAICDYVWRHAMYTSESSGPATEAVDTLLSACGVCRDLAHLAAAFCRAVEAPTRVAAVYVPGLALMDFYSVVDRGGRPLAGVGRDTVGAPPDVGPRRYRPGRRRHRVHHRDGRSCRAA